VQLLFLPSSRSYASLTPFYSHSSPCRRFCFDTELPSCLCPETIHVGESCAQSGNRTRSCSCNRRGNARLVAITDTNIIGHFTLVVYFAYSCSLPYPGDRPAVPRTQALDNFGYDKRRKVRFLSFYYILATTYLDVNDIHRECSAIRAQQ
jgi:hypothetical protein